MALKIKVVEKVVEHFEKDTHSVSPIRINGVVSTHSRILTFLHDLEKLGNVLFNESKILIKGQTESFFIEFILQFWHKRVRTTIYGT